MEELVTQLIQSQGIWAVLFVFLLLYPIKKNDKLDEMQDAREKARVFQEEARVQTEKEIKVLKEFAVQKEAEAVSAVISQLVL